MMEDVILDSDSLCSFNHCKIAVKHFFPIFNKTIPNSMGMGHSPKILGKNHSYWEKYFKKSLSLPREFLFCGNHDEK